MTYEEKGLWCLLRAGQNQVPATAVGTTGYISPCSSLGLSQNEQHKMAQLGDQEKKDPQDSYKSRATEYGE